ncbi:MAG: hypothetical protein KGL39_53060 [Patescibacteria group bacterium]|nr:hypothetical protein [Patescibacteria group bacterium]
MIPERSSLLTFAFDVDGYLRIKGVSFAPTIPAAIAQVQSDSYERPWKLGAALIASAMISPEQLSESLSSAFARPLTPFMRNVLTERELNLWKDPLPPHRLTGGVGRTSPDPF